jgi:uncharacterized protein YktB (UPF0637 family)
MSRIYWGEWTNEDLSARLKEISEKTGKPEIKEIGEELVSRIRFLTDSLMRHKKKLRELGIEIFI